MRSIILYLVLIITYLSSIIISEEIVPVRKLISTIEEDDDVPYESDDYDELERNSTGKGTYVGAPCEINCNPKLLHVFCNPTSNVCECENKYPVKLNPFKGCDKPKKLGEQCYYRESCLYGDPHSSCIQVHHNAVCQCEHGYHSVLIQKPSRRHFCAEDVEEVTTDFSTLVGVITGIAVLSGLICFTLRLFNQNMYTGRHRYGNANLAPPILFSSDAGPLAMPIIDRSMASSQRTLASVQSRRASSSQGCRGIPVSASRAGAARTAAILLLSYHDTITDVPFFTTKSRLGTGSRRPSITSIHSGSSIRSYSAKRYEKERQQKEEREMLKRLSKINTITTSNSRLPPTPSPHSIDEPYPLIEEFKRVPLAIQEESSSSFQDELPSTSKQYT